VVEYLSQDLGCDHSVNICMCSTIGIVQELNMAMEGKLACPRCGGEGFVWDDKAFEDAVRQTAAHFQISDKEARWECEMAGNVKCPECDSAGYVRMTGVNA
jgi:RecJ-like exonuclease